jgi:uncharacterized protein YndB with AHSA1/START domain
MGYAEASRIINAPVEAVWNALNDIDHTPDWVTGLENAEIVTTGEYGAGTIYTDYNRLGPVLQTTPWRITVFEPMTHQVHESESATLPSKMTIKLTPAPEGTHLHMIVEYQFLPRLGAFGRLLENVLMNRLIKQVLTQNQTSLDVYLGRSKPG